MDPVTAFNVAGTIVQFIDSGTRFVVLARKLYQHGSDDASDHHSLQKMTEDLDTILSELQLSGDHSDRGQSLSQLALDCGKTTARLLTILQKTKVPENSRKRDALRAAFRSLCNEDEIKSLQTQLSSFRNQLNLHLLLSLR